MLPGDAAAARRPPGVLADDTQHPSVSSLPWRRSQKSRRKSKPITRAFGASRPSGGGTAATPPEPPTAPEGVDLRRALPRSLSSIPPSQPPFRFWVDELLWSQGRVAVELLEQVLVEAGGVRTGGPTRQEERARRRRELTEAPGHGRAPSGPSLGSRHLDSWEVLWTKSTYAIPAARNMRPGQLVSAVIGLNCLTMKKRLLLTLRGELGPEVAFAILPRSFALPEELDAWADWVRHHQQQQQQAGGQAGRSGSPPLWILKTGQDAGKGLSLLPADLALKYAREQQKRHQEQAAAQDSGGGGGGGGAGRRFQLQVAQQYIADPFLIHGRKFHLRLWLLVTAHCPMRAYLHRRGLVLFSAETYDKGAADGATGGGGSAATSATHASGGSAAGGSSSAAPRTDAADLAPHQPPVSHVTNYARNANSLVWALGQLEEHLGTERFAGLWTRVCSACGAALAAAAPSLAEAYAWLQPAVQEYGFQVLGVDFLLDEQLTPWLLEFNSAPSIMVQHECPATKALVYEQKYGMLRDTWQLIRSRVYRPSSAEEEAQRGRAGSRLGGGGMSARNARFELANAGEYEPLMSYILRDR